VPDAVDTVVCAPDDGWKYHPKHVEQFPEINKLCNVASCWMYIRIISLCLHSEQDNKFTIRFTLTIPQRKNRTKKKLNVILKRLYCQSDHSGKL